MHIARIACIPVVVAALATSGCSLLKLTVLTGPGCCQDAGATVVPLGPLEQRATVRASLTVAAAGVIVPGAPPPPGVFVVPVVVAPPRADLRFACLIEERTAAQRVTQRSVEYAAQERFALGGWAVVAAALATVAGADAASGDDALDERIGLGVLSALLAVDALATGALALFHPETRYVHTSDRAGSWTARADACPADLRVDVAGVSVPVGSDGRVAELDALRIAQVVEQGAPINVRTAAAVAPLSFVATPTAAGTALDGLAVLGP